MGYGCVNMKKVFKGNVKDEYGNEYTKLVVEVKGNHERGLVPCMARQGYVYDARKWVFNRFEKEFNGKDSEIEMFISEDYVKEGNLDVEVATYTFLYNKRSSIYLE